MNNLLCPGHPSTAVMPSLSFAALGPARLPPIGPRVPSTLCATPSRQPLCSTVALFRVVLARERRVWRSPWSRNSRSSFYHISLSFSSSFAQESAPSRESHLARESIPTRRGNTMWRFAILRSRGNLPIGLNRRVPSEKNPGFTPRMNHPDEPRRSGSWRRRSRRGQEMRRGSRDGLSELRV